MADHRHSTQSPSPGDAFALVHPSPDGVIPERPRTQLPLEPELERPWTTTPYVLSSDAATAINAAIAVDQPLLVTGEPGCGKTSLAYAVAGQLGMKVEVFSVKSTSVARDVLYSFDALRRFYDAQVKSADATDPHRYLHLNALGRAIDAEDSRVVLIDEIDKAPRDFPNDLLHEIDRKEFSVPEVEGPPLRQRCRHFVLITSNGERRLPGAFLRRCVYLDLPFPDRETLGNIILARTSLSKGTDGALIDAVLGRFEELRRAGLEKPPSTSELLAWLLVLQRRGTTAPKLRTVARLIDLPALDVLIKLREDRERLG